MEAATEDLLFVDLLAGAPGVRDALRARLQGATHPQAAARAATLLLLDTLVDFADFRGLPQAIAAFDPAQIPDAEQPRADAARLGLASLDHRFDIADPALLPVRERLFGTLRNSHLPPDERVLLAKLLLDHHSMRNDEAACLRLLSLMTEVLPAASPAWQARWWRLAAETHVFWGHAMLAREDLAQLQALLPRVDSPDIALAQACEEMRQAMNAGDLARAARAFRNIEQLRAHVRPALLPRGLRAQVSLLLRRGEHAAARERTALILALCEDHEVPQRDRAGYVELQAHALAGLGRHDEGVALLESLRATQSGGQAEVLEALVTLARAVQALEHGDAAARPLALQAVRQAAAVGFQRFLMPFPARAARIAALALDAGVEVEFLRRAVRERRLPPPEPARERWPWALHVYAFGGLRVERDGEAHTGSAGKAPRKPLELLALLAARPGGVDSDELVERLWPSLDAEAPKASLEMAVARLRKWLDEPDAVRVAEGHVSLHPALVWTDVGAFEAACDRGDAEGALAICRAPLLPRDAQVAPERQRLADRLVAVVLGAAASRPGAAARALLMRALASQPGAEPLRAALRELS